MQLVPLQYLKQSNEREIWHIAPFLCHSTVSGRVAGSAEASRFPNRKGGLQRSFGFHTKTCCFRAEKFKCVLMPNYPLRSGVVSKYSSANLVGTRGRKKPAFVSKNEMREVAAKHILVAFRAEKFLFLVLLDTTSYVTMKTLLSCISFSEE